MKGTGRYNDRIAEEEFVTPLPKKLLANPDGPIAFIGHVDMALWMIDPPTKFPTEIDWNKLVPYWGAARNLISTTVGDSLKAMNSTANSQNAEFVRLSAEKKAKRAPENVDNLISKCFLERTDAKNFLIFGDPAVKLNFE